MQKVTLTCPKCQSEIELSETLAAPLVQKLREQDLKQLQTEREKLSEANAELAAKQKKLADAEAAFQEQLELQAAQKAKQLFEIERKKLQEDQALKLQDFENQLQEATLKLNEAQQKELELLKNTRALEAKTAQAELELQRRLNEEAGKIREETQRDLNEQYRLREAEKEKTISDLRGKLDEMQRRLEQGSQQLQGEVQELDLELTLRAAFPYDQIERIIKGQTGGDVTQRVIAPNGQEAGIILWEAKRTKAWSEGWLSKLRDDQRAIGAEVCALASHVLPKGVAHFGQVDGVWVCSPLCSVPLALALREALIKVALVRQAGEGRQTKMALLYDYLSGSEFSSRLAGIAEPFKELQDDLQQEKRAMNKRWAQREKQLNRALTSVTGLYGDLQGIVGAAIAQLPEFELSPLPSPEQENEPDELPFSLKG